MSEYTPTTDEVRSASSRYIGLEDFDRWLAAHDAEVLAEERERAALHAEEGYRLEEHCDDIAKRIRSGEPAEIAARPSVVDKPEGDHVFIERYGMHHAKFGGIGGEVTSLGLTREAWKSMGEPDVLAVSFEPVREDD